MNYEFKLWQDGQIVAAGESADQQLLIMEALRYTSQYAEDGDVRLVIKEKKGGQRAVDPERRG